MSFIRMIPRKFWYLLAVAASMAGLLTLVDPDGGPERLFPVDAEDVSSLSVARRGATTILVRDGEGWRLEGDLVDHVDTAAVDALLADVLIERRSAGPAHEGDGPLPASFGLEGPGALAVTVRTVAGDVHAARVGAVNPVTQVAYVLFEDAVHLARAELRSRLDGLPDVVRAARLVPDAVAADVLALTLQRTGEDRIDALVRDGDGLWWRLAEDEAPASLAGTALAYVAAYDDRTRTDAPGRRWRAEESRVRDLLASLFEAGVRGFHPADRPDGAVDLITLTLDLADGGRRTLDLGPARDGDQGDAWRDGAARGFGVVHLPRRFAETLREAPLTTSLHSRPLALADSFSLRGPVGPPLVIHPSADRDWIAARRDDLGSQDRNVVRDAAMLFAGLEILAIPPATADPDAAFGRGPRYELTVWYGDEGDPEVHLLGPGRDGGVVARRVRDGFVARVLDDVPATARAVLSAVGEP